LECVSLSFHVPPHQQATTTTTTTTTFSSYSFPLNIRKRKNKIKRKYIFDPPCPGAVVITWR
jgi:hypothetical protein